jgi:hypothetical protein
MAGFGPMAFSPFPYGAVPSSGVASDKFVDLFNDQTATGYKSWIITHQTSTILPWAEWGVTKDATSRIMIEDNTSSNSVATPSIRRIQAGTAATLDIYQGTTDTGSNAINAFRFRIGTGSSVVTRPLCVWQNNATTVASITGANSLTVQFPITHRSYTVATLPSAAIAGQEVYVSDAAVAPCLAFTNGTNWKRCDNAATTVV